MLLRLASHLLAASDAPLGILVVAGRPGAAVPAPPAAPAAPAAPATPVPSSVPGNSSCCHLLSSGGGGRASVNSGQ